MGHLLMPQSEPIVQIIYVQCSAVCLQIAGAFERFATLGACVSSDHRHPGHGSSVENLLIRPAVCAVQCSWAEHQNMGVQQSSRLKLIPT